MNQVGMPMVLIDYTPFYLTSVLHAPLSPVVAGKFVQIRNGNRFYLVLSPVNFTKYHANIIERFCMDKGIEGSYDANGRSSRSLTTSGKSSAAGSSSGTRTKRPSSCTITRWPTESSMRMVWKKPSGACLNYPATQ
jgi:hypothetical protein